MTKSATKVLETDVVIFQLKSGQNVKETVLANETENNPINENKKIENDNDGRFARLKKSLRKKSASIL